MPELPDNSHTQYNTYINTGGTNKRTCFNSDVYASNFSTKFVQGNV